MILDVLRDMVINKVLFLPSVGWQLWRPASGLEMYQTLRFISRFESLGWAFFSDPYQFSSVQSLGRVRLFATPWIAAWQASLSITISRSSLRLMSIESVMPSSHPILGCPLLQCTQSLLASESFAMSQLFSWGRQITGVSASAASFPPKKSQGWSPS